VCSTQQSATRSYHSNVTSTWEGTYLGRSQWVWRHWTTTSPAAAADDDDDDDDDAV